MHASHAPLSLLHIGDFMYVDDIAGASSMYTEPHPAIFFAKPREPKHICQETSRACKVTLPEPSRMQAAYLVFGGNRAIFPGGKEPFVICLYERKLESMRI